MSCTDKQDAGSKLAAEKDAARERGNKTYSPGDAELHDEGGRIIWCKFYNLIIPQCQDCQEEFVIDYDGQSFWREKGYAEMPQRCKACYRTYKKQMRSEPTATHPQSQAHTRH